MNATAQKGDAPKTRRGEDEDVLPVTWKIDTNIVDLSKRPLVGEDINRWRARHRLQIVDAIYALGISNSAKYNAILRRKKALPFSFELLMRLYDRYPAHAPWERVTMQDAFGFLYGDIKEQFEREKFSHEVLKEVRLALYRRFTNALGRSVYTAYRWIDQGGNASAQIEKICSILSTMDNPREVLESLTREMYKTRRADFDQMFPIPEVENPPQPKRRGPVPKAVKEAVAAAAKPGKAAKKVKSTAKGSK